MEVDYSAVSRRVGLAAIGTAGLLSAVSTCMLLCYMAYCSTLGAHKSPLTIGVRKFVRSCLGRYLIALLVSDFFQGSAFTINYHWARVGRMHEGRVCLAQGSLSQFGDLGAAMWSLIISFHTFWLLFLQRKPADWVCHTTLIAVGAFLVIMPIIGSHVIQKAEGQSFWGLSGAWCWIGDTYQVERLVYLYLWVFMNLICSLVTYTLIYLKFSGVVEYDGGRFVFHGWRSGSSRRWTLGPGTQPSNEESGGSDERGSAGHVSKSLVSIARRLMWYPIVYAFVVIPVSICRLGVMAGWEPPFWLFVLAGICFSSSGLTNTILFIFTRHSLIQRITRPQGIRVTTHKLTVTDAGNPPISGHMKVYPLDELHSNSIPHIAPEPLRYAVQFKAGGVKKQGGLRELEDQAIIVKGRQQYADWAYTPP